MAAGEFQKAKQDSLAVTFLSPLAFLGAFPQQESRLRKTGLHGREPHLEQV